MENTAIITILVILLAAVFLILTFILWSRLNNKSQQLEQVQAQQQHLITQASLLQQQNQRLQDALTTNQEQAQNIQNSYSQLQITHASQQARLETLELNNAELNSKLAANESLYLEQNKITQQALSAKEFAEKELSNLQQTLSKAQAEAKELLTSNQNKADIAYSTLQEKQRQELSQLRKEHTEQIQALTTTAQTEKNKALEDSKALYEKQLADLKVNHHLELERLKQAHQEQIQQLESNKNTQVTQLEKSNREQLATLQAQTKANLELMRQELQNSTNDLIKRTSEQFTQDSSKNLEAISKPLQENMQLIVKGAQELLDKNKETSTQFNEKINSFDKQIALISEQAVSLSNALRGTNKKALGNWGELQLEQTLQHLGLTPEIHYDSQKAITRNNERFVLDFVLKLPHGRQVIIDCKTSLNAYQEAFNAENKDVERAAIERLVKDVEKHYSDLAKKNYQNLEKDKSLEFVVMYIPIDNVLSYIASYKPQIFSDALKQNIVIVSNSTLIPLIALIDRLWKNYTTGNELSTLVKTSELLFDSIAGIASKTSILNKDLSKIIKTFNDLVTTLGGTQGAIRRVERLNTHAQKASKAISEIEKLETVENHNSYQTIEEFINKTRYAQDEESSKVEQQVIETQPLTTQQQLDILQADSLQANSSLDKTTNQAQLDKKADLQEQDKLQATQPDDLTEKQITQLKYLVKKQAKQPEEQTEEQSPQLDESVKVQDLQEGQDVEEEISDDETSFLISADSLQQELSSLQEPNLHYALANKDGTFTTSKDNESFFQEYEEIFAEYSKE